VMAALRSLPSRNAYQEMNRWRLAVVEKSVRSAHRRCLG
jgi:hypothetical protein